MAGRIPILSDIATYRILYIEDDEDVAELCRLILAAKGYYIETALTGADGLAKFKDNPFDIVLLDYRLPDTDGLELARILLNIAPDLPIVFITTKGSEMVAAEALAIGVANYIIKDTIEVYEYLLPEVLQKIVAGRESKRRAEEQLRLSESRLSSAQELAKVGYFERDLLSQDIYWSDNNYEIYGVKPGTKINDALFLTLIHPEDLEYIQALMAEFSDTGKNYNAEFRIVLADGEEKILRSSTVSVAGDAENPATKSIGAVRDVTEERYREAQLRQALKMEVVGQLTGGIAHDFNNMLAGLQGNLDLMSDPTISEEERLQRLDRSKAIVERGATLTKQLLAFSRKQNLQPKATDVGGLMDAMLDLMRRSLGETIAISMDFAPGLWPALVDPNQLESAALNLAVNARDAMPNGGTLSLLGRNIQVNSQSGENPLGMAAGDYISISIHDTGHGIPEDQLGKVFDPFYTTKDVGEGSGLGLSMVYGFAKQSGGYAFIRSDEGTGTEVILYLPRAEAPGLENADADAALAPAIGAGERIMIIEDDPDVRDVTAAALAMLGYEVIDGGDGSDAIRIGYDQEKKIDLLLTDVVLPNGNSGPDLAAALSEKWRQMKVLMMTGYAENEILRTIDDELKHTLIQKPFRTADLSKQIHALLTDNNG